MGQNLPRVPARHGDRKRKRCRALFWSSHDGQAKAGCHRSLPKRDVQARMEVRRQGEGETRRAVLRDQRHGRGRRSRRGQGCAPRRRPSAGRDAARTLNNEKMPCRNVPVMAILKEFRAMATGPKGRYAHTDRRRCPSTSMRSTAPPSRWRVAHERVTEGLLCYVLGCVSV